MEESNKISSILQCFVDTNLELNENYPYRMSVMPNVFFTQLQHSVEEGQGVEITLSLSEPSLTGSEEVVIGFFNSGATQNDISTPFPQVVSWDIGEQAKTITIDVVEDFMIELNESFFLAITSTINCIALESQDKTLVSIVDTTVLKRVSFVQNEGGYILPYWNGAQNINYLSYETNSFSNPVLKLALNEPSESGTETISVSVFTSVLSPEFITSKTVSFEAGEQYKEVEINNIPDVVLSNFDVLLVKLIPEMMSIENATVLLNYENGYTDSLIYVGMVEPGIQRKYTTITFRDILRQKGATIDSKPAELRTVQYNQGVSTILSEEQNNWLLRFNDTYTDFSNYNDQYPNPAYKFGTDFDGNPGELVLVVENAGESFVEIDGNTYNPGESFEVPINTFNFQITLPSNAGLVQNTSDFSQFTEVPTEGVLTESLYTIKVRNNGLTLNEEENFYTHNFSPKNENNFIDKTFNFGTHFLPNFDTQIQASAQPLYMANKYQNILTRYNGGACTNHFSLSNNVFDIKILGFILLDGNNTESNYIGTEFIHINDFNPICGEYNGEMGSPDWKGVEFELAQATTSPTEADTSEIGLSNATDNSEIEQLEQELEGN